MKSCSIATCMPVDRLSRGSTADTWLAERRGERVVVKVYRAEQQSAQLARQECRAERLDHPNIARVIGGGVLPAFNRVWSRDEPHHYTVQEYAQGKPATCVFGWQRMKARLRGVLLGLEHAHARGLIHRDIKPDNVMVGEDGPTDGVKIIDWGMCWDMRPGARNPFKAHTIGTPGYMPLEQVLGQPQLLGPWSDIYAVGALAHRMATGCTPLRGGTARAVLDEAQRIALDGASVPNCVNPLEWGQGFVEWVGWLLSIPIAQRPQSAREALDALEALEGPAEDVS